MDRRGFLELFATVSVGVPVAQHIGLLEHLKSWVLGPKRTIFIPPAVELAQPFAVSQISGLMLEGLQGIPYYHNSSMTVART